MELQRYQFYKRRKKVVVKDQFVLEGTIEETWTWLKVLNP